MKIWSKCAIASILLTLTACSGGGELVRYYMLAPTLSQQITQADETIVLGIGPITVPRHLDRPEILRRTGDHRIELLTFDHWAEPLADTIPRVLGQNLEQHFGASRVETFPYPRSSGVTHQVALDVLVFDQATNGEVRVDVRWRLISAQSEEVLHARTTRLRVTPIDGSVTAMVQALSAGLGELSKEIAEAPLS